MKAHAALLVAALAAAVSADKGDVFLSVGPALEVIESDEPAFGLGGGISLGVNEQTDFQLEVDATANPGYFDEEGVMATRWLLASYFTPFFGDIRPRFGGSFGLVHLNAASENHLLFDAGFHLQGLYQVSDGMRLFAEVVPNIVFGDEGGFSTLVKLGLQFRLSK